MSLLPIKSLVKGTFRNITVGFPISPAFINKRYNIIIISSAAIGPDTFAVIYYDCLKLIPDFTHVGHILTKRTNSMFFN